MSQVTFSRVLVNSLVVVLCLTVSVQSASINPALTDSLLEKSKNAIMAIDTMIENQKQLINGLSKGECTTAMSQTSDMLNKAMKNLLKDFITENNKELSEISFDIPKYTGQLKDNKTIVTDFTMKNCILKGVENVQILKSDFDMCTLSSEIEINLPKLELTGTYHLIGSIDELPITGDGTLKVDIDSLYFYDQTFMDCDLALLSKDGCRYSNKNKTVDITARKVVVNVSGIKFNDLSESQINEGFNEYIDNYIQSSRVGVVEKIAEALESYKNKMVSRVSPIRLLKKFKMDLMNVQKHARDGKTYFDKNNIYKSYIFAYI